MSNALELADIRAELADRFGPPPPEVQHLVELAATRVAAHSWGITSIHLEDRFAVFRYSSGRQIRQLADLSGGKLRVVDGQGRLSAAGQRRYGFVGPYGQGEIAVAAEGK